MIEQFLRNGRLGELHLGLTRNDVRRLLGDPADYSENNKIWKYGGLQVSFSLDSLSFIGLYFDNGVLTLPAVMGELTFMENNIENFERFMLANRIEYTVNNTLTFDDQKTLHLIPSQVNVTFSEGRLHSMQLRQPER